MTDERWTQVKHLFADALEVPVADRDGWLERACGKDLELLARVRQMLTAHESSRGFQLAAAERAELQGPRVLGDFELGPVIGSGGMGVVHRARQLSLDREVAVKVLHEDVARDPVRIEHFRSEAKRVGQLNHVGIVPIYVFGQTGDTWYFAMELVDGQDLHRDLELQRRADPADPDSLPLLSPFGSEKYYRGAAAIIIEVAEALQYAHDQGVVHRDVKPQNILLMRSARAKVVDFGIARDAKFGAIAAGIGMPGTPHYMSPEQVTAARMVVDHRTDIYSLGVVLFQLLTLRLPFDGATSSQVLDSIRRFEPPDPLHINRGAPRDLVSVCMQAMARDPAARYATASQFADDAQRFLRGEPVLAPASTHWVRSWNTLRRRRRTIAGIVAALVTCGICVAIRKAWMEQRSIDLAAARHTAECVDVHLTIVGATPEQCRVRIDRIDPTLDRGVIQPEPIAFQSQVDGDSIILRQLPSADVLITVDAAVGRAELRRILRAGATAVTERAYLHSDQEATRDMVLVKGGSVQLLFEPLSNVAGIDSISTCFEVPPFWIDRSPLTNAQYDAFARATGVARPPHWCGSLPDDWSDRPVTFVDAESARACAEWYGKRLPTRAEFEWVRHGESGFPWPLMPDRSSIACAREAFSAPFRPTSVDLETGLAAIHDWYAAFIPSVTHLPAANAGVLSSFGIVREWVDDAPIEREHGGFVRVGGCRYRLGMSCEERFDRALQRYSSEPQLQCPVLYPDPATGFRCVRSARR